MGTETHDVEITCMAPISVSTTYTGPVADFDAESWLLSNERAFREQAAEQARSLDLGDLELIDGGATIDGVDAREAVERAVEARDRETYESDRGMGVDEIGLAVPAPDSGTGRETPVPGTR